MQTVLLVLWLIFITAFTVDRVYRYIQRQRVSPTVDLILRLIETDRDWFKDTYHWYHPTGVSMWVANKDYGLGIVIDAKYKGDAKPNTDNTQAGHIRLNSRERKAIWNAVSGHADNKHDTVKLRALADRITEMYGDK